MCLGIAEPIDRYPYPKGFDCQFLRFLSRFFNDFKQIYPVFIDIFIRDIYINALIIPYL